MLKKDLYELKQATRAWYGRIDSFLTSLGFTKSKANRNLYMNIMDDEPDILLMYVDDQFLDVNGKQIRESKKKIAKEFEMKDLVLIHYFLEMEVWKILEGIFLNQGKYVVEILKIFIC